MGKVGPVGGDVVILAIMIQGAPSWLTMLEAKAAPSAHSASLFVKHALSWASGRTGLPVVVVAALALVVAWRVVRRTWHIALELALALTVLLVATRLGWIRW